MDIYRAIEILKITKEFDNIKGTASSVAIGIALSALEYQIPKKPLPKGTHKGFDNYCCPSCNHILSNQYEEYELPCCGNCGQKLDWKLDN